MLEAANKQLRESSESARSLEQIISDSRRKSETQRQAMQQTEETLAGVQSQLQLTQDDLRRKERTFLSLVFFPFSDSSTDCLQRS